MKRVLLLGCCALACTLDGDGERESVSRLITEDFDAVEVFNTFQTTIGVDASLPSGISRTVRLSGDSNALDHLFVGVHAERTLSAAVDPNNLVSLSLRPELAISIPALVKLYADDQTTTTVTGGTGEIRVEAHDQAVVLLAETAMASLTVEAADDAIVTLTGAGPVLTIVVSGAAAVDAQGFAADRVVVDARGSGTVFVCSAAEPEVTGDGPVVRRC